MLIANMLFEQLMKFEFFSALNLQTCQDYSQSRVPKPSTAIASTETGHQGEMQMDYHSAWLKRWGALL